MTPILLFPLYTAPAATQCQWVWPVREERRDGQALPLHWLSTVDQSKLQTEGSGGLKTKKFFLGRTELATPKVTSGEDEPKNIRLSFWAL